MPRRLLSILVAVVSLIWAGLFTWTEIIDADPDTYSVNSPEFKQELANCAGNFAQRQACAERIAEAHQQLGFLNWLEKVAIILGPPLILWGLLSYATRESGREPVPESPRRAAGAPRGAVRDEPRRVGPRMREPHFGTEPFGSDAAADGSLTPAEGGRGAAARETGPGPHHDGAPAPPLFSGGRREPIRHRDR